jgi:isopenicillin-N N-acyltransferase-like protein
MAGIEVAEFADDKGGLETGRQHGEHYRSKIRDFVASFPELNIMNTAVAVDKEDLLDLCARNNYFLVKFYPELVDEMTGIADGAGVDYGDVLLLNCFLELNDIRAPKAARRILDKRNWGCTTFNIKPRGSETGEPLLGQTYDMEKYFADYNVVFKIKGKDGSRKLVYSLAGVLGLNGLNDKGVSVVINKLVPLDSRPGVVYPFLIRRALDQRRIGDALAGLAFAPRASGLCYQLACPEGVAFCLETTAAQHQVLRFSHGLAHTNHYLSPLLQPLEADWLDQGGSYVRLEVAQDTLDDNRGKVTVGLLQNLCRNHINEPRSICAHFFPDEPEHRAMATISAVVIEPAKLTMHFADCFPCRQEFVAVKL